MSHLVFDAASFDLHCFKKISPTCEMASLAETRPRLLGTTGG